MTVTPSGRLALPLAYLRNLLAASSTFQTLLGVASTAAAKAKIYFGGIEDDNASNLPPRAIIRIDQGDIASRTGTTTWRGTGPLELLITLADPTGVTLWEDKYLTILNQLGAIIDEMFALVETDPGAGPYLYITEIQRKVIGQWDADAEGTSAYWEAEFTVNWEGM